MYPWRVSIYDPKTLICANLNLLLLHTKYQWITSGGSLEEDFRSPKYSPILASYEPHLNILKLFQDI